MEINKDYFNLSRFTDLFIYYFRRGYLLQQIADRIKWHLLPKINYVPPFPTHLDIELASACQLRCPMCPTGNGMMSDDKKGVMAWAIFKKIVDEAKINGVYSIKLSWRGEPHLNKDMWKMVRYAKKIGIKDVATLSNGENMNEEHLVELVESGMDWISFSVDGMKESYDRIRHPAKFDDIVFKIKKIVEIRNRKSLKKPLIRIQSILSSIEGDPAEFFEFWGPIVDKVNFIADEDRADDMRNFPRDPNFICPSPWQRMTIGYDGEVFPCVSDYLARDPVGDVKSQTLKEIWNDKKISELRHAHLTKSAFSKYDSCGDCCHGGLMSEKTIKVNNREIKIKKYVGQDPNITRMGGRLKPKEGNKWYEEVKIPEKGRRRLEKSKNKG